jgi:hypothetical protein
MCDRLIRWERGRRRSTAGWPLPSRLDAPRGCDHRLELHDPVKAFAGVIRLHLEPCNARACRGIVAVLLTCWLILGRLSTSQYTGGYRAKSRYFDSASARDAATSTTPGPKGVQSP